MEVVIQIKQVDEANWEDVIDIQIEGCPVRTGGNGNLGWAADGYYWLLLMRNVNLRLLK